MKDSKITNIADYLKPETTSPDGFAGNTNNVVELYPINKLTRDETGRYDVFYVGGVSYNEIIEGIKSLEDSDVEINNCEGITHIIYTKFEEVVVLASLNPPDKYKDSKLSLIIFKEKSRTYNEHIFDKLYGFFPKNLH